jgi:hypothetical protein
LRSTWRHDLTQALCGCHALGRRLESIVRDATNRTGCSGKRRKGFAGDMETQPRTEWTVVMFLGLALISGVGALARSGIRLPIGRV